MTSSSTLTRTSLFKIRAEAPHGGCQGFFLPLFQTKKERDGDGRVTITTAQLPLPRKLIKPPSQMENSSMVMRSRATHGRSASKCQENGQIRPFVAVRPARDDGSRPRRQLVLPKLGKSAKICASSGVIPGIREPAPELRKPADF